VVAVLCFHQGFGWASGGFLGVSLFFTLSGYLITRLLVSEHAAHHKIDLRAFWARRVRRLGPALLLTLAGVIAMGAFMLSASERAGLRGDVLASVGYVTNWRFLFDGSGYAELFDSPSLVQHFWSLAIEEQFYLLYPLVVAGVLWIGRGSRTVLGIVLSAGVTGSLALTLLSNNESRIYYGTDTRALELLAGALLALVMTRHGRGGRPRAVIGAIGLGCMVWWCTATTLETSLLYEGGFALVALTSVAVLLGATTPGPARTVLSIWPLRMLGKISYGVYLFHWPIYLWLDEARTGLSDWPLFFLRSAIVLALSIASYHFFELPIRTGRRLRAPRFGPAFVAGVTAVAITATVVIVAPSASDVIDASDFERAAKIPEPPPPPAAEPEQTAASALLGAIPDPMRVYVVGDSTGMATALGLHWWGKRTGSVVVKQGARLACGVLRGARIRVGAEIPPGTLEKCDGWPKRWALEMVETKPDVIMVVMGPANTADVFLPGDTQWRGLGDPAVDAATWEQMSLAADVLETAGVPILWFDSPYFAPGVNDRVGNQANPLRVDRYNTMIQQLADERDLIVRVPWSQLVSSIEASGASLRPDGVHVEPDRLGSMLDGGLWSEIVKSFLGVYAKRAEGGGAATATYAAGRAPARQ
jgi:peptidoglycan/LPS O-acetylase OafA/YrhL